MTKNILIAALIIASIGSAIYFLNSNQSPASKSTTQSPTSNSLTSPDRLAELNGYILSVEGNEIVIANEVGVKEINAEEKARRQKLTQEERQALKSQESANLTKQNMTITIPVGVTLVKGSGDASGSNLKAEMSEIVKGVYISIWKSGDSVEFVKLKGVSQ